MNNRIKQIEIYKNDIRVVRRSNSRFLQEKRPFYMFDTDGETIITNMGLKSEITEFSKRSRRNLAFVVSNTEVRFTRMITLTYPEEYPRDGKIVKRQLNSFLVWLRRKGIEEYLWFLEFQKRGAPHFHILISGECKIDRMEVSTKWFNTVGSGDEKHYLAGTRIERGKKSGGLHKYAIKYSQKLYQKNVPPDYESVGRFWGCSGGVYPQEPYVIKVETESDLSALLVNWQYSGKEKDGYTILFNASDSVVSLLLDLGYFGLTVDGKLAK